MCGAHAAVRMLVGELIEHNRRNTVIDMEAGVEHLSRGTIRFVDFALVVVEPYFKSMETGARIARLASELGISRVLAIANKVRSPADSEALRSFCDDRGLRLWGEIPFDESLLQAERVGQAPLDFDAGSPAMAALGQFATRLRTEAC